ncbi:MAG: RNA polymerase sigma factor [Clostridia bacterium]|nr:RNA polymerase sigma factor [Clostridia bacterium]MBR0509676.1 RNA polymerase sigma factor [Clostridia bacterium]
MDEKELKKTIAAAQKGSVEAFGALYERYRQDLYRFALWYVHDPNDAEDAVQDAMVNAFKNIRLLRKPDSFHSWLFTILANACRAILQKRQRDAVSLEDAPEALRLCTYDSYDTGQTGRLLGSLKEEDRQIVVLSVFGDLNSKEIGELLGMKSVTVRSRLSRALQSLRITAEQEAS